MSESELLKNIKLWYDGYSYDGETFLYNPFSLLNFFRKKRFGNFWFATGTPTFLVERIRETNIKPMELEQKEFLEAFFDRFTIEQLDIYNLLFQTGYLTVKSTRYDDFELRYKLGYPNREVQQSFIYNLLEAFTFQPSSVIGDVLLKIRDALREGQVEKFIDQLKILLSDISYHLFPRHKKNPTQRDKDKEFAAWEGYFQTIIYLITAFVGYQVQTEITKHKGRLDLLVEAKNHLYLMEFKLDEPIQDAIQQIKNRQYAASYKNSPKTIWLVGVNFSKEERNIENWEVEEWQRNQ